MEKENKVEDKIAEVAETTPAEKKEEKKVETPAAGKKKCCGTGLCSKKNCKKHGMILAAVVLVLLIAGSFAYKQYREKIDIGPDAIKAKVQKFVTEQVPATSKTSIKDITVDGELYKVTVTVDTQDIPVYVTRDGKKLMQAQGVIDLDQTAPAPAASDAAAAAPEKTVADKKADVPAVDLYVMSFCPYGTQIEKGILPVLNALGSKIKFNLKFVDYSMHGPNEIDENLRQYCIEKTQQPKLDAYLACYLKVGQGTADACMATAGINVAPVTACVSATDTQFSVHADAADKTKWSNGTYPPFNVEQADNTKDGVQGSPTLLINGTTVSPGRDSESLLKAVCSGFTTQPKECSQALSSTAPAPGFGDGAAPAAASGAPAAACATPAQ